MNVNVQFSDSTETTVIAVFSCPQDPKVYPNQAAIPTTDSRYVAYKAALPGNMGATLP